MVVLKWWFGDGKAWIWVKVDSWWLQEATACKQMVEVVRWFFGVMVWGGKGEDRAEVAAVVN
jgi:hypothetical protein